MSNPQQRSDIRYWLALARAPGLSAVRIQRLLAAYGELRDVFAAGPRELQKFGVSAEAADYLAAPDWSAIDADLAWLDAPRRRLITLADPGYPGLLGEIPDPPPVLFVEGDADSLNSPQLAVVGSRNPTRGGAETAFDFAASLARSGWTITSGLALGVDAQAHRGAISAAGATIAVMATGPDLVYPSRHRELAAAILDNGACVSEFPTGTPVRREQFPRRNRIISGLSVGTLVVEAAKRSGSIITAHHAVNQGREAFAIPGSIHNPQARGCHALIREGAKLVETVDDILEELGPVLHAHAAADEVDLEKRPERRRNPDHGHEYERLLDCLGHDPVSVDTLVRRSGLTAREVSSMLLVLELDGQVNAEPGGVYARAK